jgi:hypothetical protein
VRAWLRLADARSHGWRVPYGDQAYGIRADLFRRIGGYPEIPLMEDLAFARACGRIGRLRRLPGAVRTTGRRLERRPVRTHLMWAVFPWLYRAGVAPDRLAQWYGAVR